MYRLIPTGLAQSITPINSNKDTIMPKTVIGAGTESVASIFTTITGLANVLGKNVSALDRASDVSYDVADTYVKNQQMRNLGSLKDTQLAEEVRDHERLAERIKFMKKQKKFIEDFPEAIALLQPASEETKPATAKKTKTATARK